MNVINERDARSGKGFKEEPGLFDEEGICKLCGCQVIGYNREETEQAQFVHQLRHEKAM